MPRRPGWVRMRSDLSRICFGHIDRCGDFLFHRKSPPISPYPRKLLDSSSNNESIRKEKRTQLFLRPGLCEKSRVPLFFYGLIAATKRVAAQGPAAYQKRTPSERRSVIFRPQVSSSPA
jgi:hypothetical protein